MQALGQSNAAQALLASLPPMTIQRAVEQDEEDEDHQLEEHDGMQRLFGVFAAHEMVQEVHARVPGVT